MAPGNRRDEDIARIIDEYGIRKYPNVTGFSNRIRKRMRRGIEVDEPVIRIYVSKKVPEHELRRDEVIPKEIAGIKTDVVELGKLKKASFTSRYRPAPCGVSTSRADDPGTGTIGWWVIDEDGNPYIISNNHVWVGESASPGDEIIQPGLADGGDPETDVIATLSTWIDLTETGTNTVDLAAASPDISLTYASIIELGGVTGKSDPVLNSTARKIGRTTGYTEGTVIDDSATVQVDYGYAVLDFTDVFIVQGENVVGAGDSGSPVLNSSDEFLGLLFAATEDGSTYIACKYSNIESELRSKMGKKIWILGVNSYPPFRTEVVYRTVEVYPPYSELTYQLLQGMSVLALLSQFMKTLSSIMAI